MDRQRMFSRMLTAVSALPGIEAIGQSGSGKLPAASESDVDLFLFCSRIPGPQQRAQALSSLGSELENMEIGAIHSRHWGEGDCVHLSGMEIWLMIFDARDQRDYLEAVLGGEHPDRVDNYFYPTGRLSTVQNMTVLFDPNGWLRSAKELLKEYPGALAEMLVSHHAAALRDTEDLERAVSRGDALFYHFALDLALDHFLQALFALNRVYFPSRKRSLEIARSFPQKPDRLDERLCEVLELGGNAGTLRQSFEGWKALVRDLEDLAVLPVE